MTLSSSLSVLQAIHRYAALLAVCVTLTPQIQAWVNQYDSPVDFSCPLGQFISHFNSEHNDYYEDRVWNFGCRQIPLDFSEASCTWTGKPVL